MNRFLSVLLLVAALVGLIPAAQALFPKKTNDFLPMWQSYLDDGALMKEVVVPGSHDSGTNTMIPYARTQSLSVEKQLSAGVRYFDLRAALNSSGKAVIYHGPIKGQAFAPVLADFRDFLTAHPSEYLLLDFQHFDSDEAKAEAFRLIGGTFPSAMLLHNTTELSDVAFIDGVKVADCRGKCVIFWGNNDAYLAEDYLFKRNNDSGTRSDCALHSYYDEDVHYGESADLIAALPGYIGKYKTAESSHGVFVLQCQLTGTGKGIQTLGMREAGHKKAMNAYLLALDAAGGLDAVTVVLRDFIDEEKSAIAISLNLRKNTVKDRFLQYFHQQTVQLCEDLQL